MARLGGEAITNASAVIAERDLSLGARIEEEDEKIDALLLEVARELAKGGEAYTNAQIADMTLLIRFYERIGDHAVSLVRRIGFLVTGDSIDTLSSGSDVQEI